MDDPSALINQLRSESAALRESEARYRRLIEQAPIGIFLAEADGRYIDVNPAGCELLGYTRDEILQMTMRDLIAPEDTVITPVRLTELQTGQSIHSERRLVCKDGRQLDVEISGQQLDNGQLLGFVRDLSERTHADRELAARLATETALHESEDRLRQVLDNSQDAAYRRNLQTDSYDYLSPAITGMTGLAVADMMSMPIDPTLAHMHADDVEEVNHIFAESAAHPGRAYQVEYRFKHIDNHYRWLQDRFTTLLDADGRPAFRYGSVRDITERRQMEEDLRQSEAMYRLLAENASDAVILIDPAGRVVFASPAMYRRLGYSEEETVNLDTPSILTRVHPDDRERIAAEIRRGRELKLPSSRYEFRAMTKAGDYIWLEDILRREFDADGRLIRVIIHSRDITERKRAEQAEREQRVLAEALRDTAAALNSTLDLDEVFDRILANVERVVPLEAADIMLIDNGLAHIVRHRGFAEHGMGEVASNARFQVEDVPNMRYMLETGQPLAIPDVREYPGWVDTPEVHWVTSHVAAPLRLKGRIIGLLNLNTATPRFYTPQHAERLQAFADQAAVAVENARLYEQVQQHSQLLEQRVADRTAELRAVNARLVEIDRLKDEFLARISHELRTPLTSIIIYLDLLENSKPEKRDKYLHTLKHEANRLHGLIEEVLTFSKLNLTAGPVLPDTLDLNNLIEGRLTTWQNLNAERSLTLKFDLASGLPHIHTNAELVVQALTRLITNAINYTPSGSVTVSTALQTADDGHWATVSIADTGLGITPDDLPHIFERFYRGRAAADYKTPGTGIGLSICREIAEKLSGRLTVETQVGVGSTFTLWLPVTV